MIPCDHASLNLASGTIFSKICSYVLNSRGKDRIEHLQILMVGIGAVSLMFVIGGEWEGSVENLILIL